jgi:hypothetical protein
MQATQPGGTGSLELILGLLKNLRIRALVCLNVTRNEKLASTVESQETIPLNVGRDEEEFGLH